ncbi:unnamed protein product [Urochloa decumbens]|uniref:Transposase MuDR plant domain-containing protein n=1 Tax=Urochloa decumbens TaxID=240449 RepID=A0ABC9AYR1_9POAL
METDPVGRGKALAAMMGCGAAMEGSKARAEFFSLEITVEGFCSTDSLGRKSYSKGKVIKWNVEIGTFSFELFMNSLRNEVKWADNQAATVWFFDKRVGEDVRLTNEIEMVDLFEMYKSEMSCHVVVSVCAKSVCDEHELDDLEPLCMVLPDDIGRNHTAAHQTAPTTAQQTAQTGDGVSASKVADSKGPAAKEADAPEPERMPDMFDNDEEYIGVDNEHIYMPDVNAQPNAPAPENATTDDADDGTDDPFADIGGAPHEPEVNDQDPQEIHVIHDLENPVIAIGSNFLDIVAFRKAIRHHVVKVGFELAGLKIDKTRFIAHCAAEGCPWRIHASTLFDKKTVQVYLYHVSSLLA